MPQIKDSLYEQLNPLTTVAGQHFVEDFSGDTLDTFRWYSGNSTGGTVAMSDSVNGGVILDTGGTQVRTEINLQNIRPFDSQASACIWVGKTGQTTNTELLFGLADANGLASSDVAFVDFNSGSSANWRLNESFSETLDTSVAVDTNFHIFKLELGSSSVGLSIDGVLGATSSAAINSDKLQPEVHLHDLSATTNTASFTYCEAWNT